LWDGCAGYETVARQAVDRPCTQSVQGAFASSFLESSPLANRHCPWMVSNTSLNTSLAGQGDPDLGVRVDTTRMMEVDTSLRRPAFCGKATAAHRHLANCKSKLPHFGPCPLSFPQYHLLINQGVIHVLGLDRNLSPPPKSRIAAVHWIMVICGEVGLNWFLRRRLLWMLRRMR
jgi:hypothetical protein